MSGNLSIDSFDPETGVISAGEEHHVEFEVTAELLQEARALINSQSAVYREPKLTIAPIGDAPISQSLWGALGRGAK
jgi:hypothetical protein